VRLGGYLKINHSRIDNSPALNPIHISSNPVCTIIFYLFITQGS